MSTKVHNSSITKPKKLIAIVMLASFLLNLTVYPAGAQVLPAPGTSVGLTAGFQPPVLLGLKIHPENPLLFDFIVDQGVSKLSEDELKLETEKLVKYFLAALTIPDKEVWVNLSPYEKDRIIPDVLGQTVMGKAMLEQDYMLKQLASSLTNPDEKIGHEFWSKVKAEVRNKLGNTDVPMNTFNKVWIVPERAEVLESQGIVVVGEKRLQVMMDEDYVAMEKNVQHEAAKVKDVNTISSKIFKGTVLPDIEKEINEGKNFADVRQIYNSVILAAWYKQALKESLLGKVYADQGKVAGVETDDKEMKQKIYDQYIAAFKKGVYNLIKEESDSATGDMIPRKYFSGGIKIAKFVASSSLRVQQVSSADLERNLRSKSTVNTVTVRLTEDQQEAVASSTIFEQANFITIRSGKLFAQMRQEIPELDLSEFKSQDTIVIYQIFTAVYRALADRIIADREGRSVEDIVNDRVEMSEVWFAAQKSNFQWKSFNAGIRKRSEEILAGVGLDGSKDMLQPVKVALISSITADFVYQWQKMNERPKKTGASSPLDTNEEDLIQQGSFSNREPQFIEPIPLVVMGAGEVLDNLAGGGAIDISERIAGTKVAVQDAEVKDYINEETLGKIIDQVIMIYYFGPRNDRPVYFDAMGLDGNPAEQKAAIEIAAKVLGFEKAPDDGRGHEGYSPQLYGYKMSNGSWASYRQLAFILDQYGISMPGVSSSAVIEKVIGTSAQSVLQSFSETAQDDMQAYADLMAKKGESVIDVAKNGMAKEFLRILILNMLQHNFSNFESLNFQNWREISDVLHWIPEQIPSPGDFINQLTVLPSDGKLDKILSEREFHEKFKVLVNQAVAEIKKFKAEMQEHKKTIFDMLDSEVDSSWNAIAALKDLVTQGDFVAATSEYYQVLRDNKLIDESGMMSAPLKAALQFFVLPNAEAILKGDRNFTYTASSGVSAVDRVLQMGLRRSEIFDFPTGSIIILKSLQGLPYTFVKVGERPAYKNVVPKFGLLEGDFRNTPISDLDKMIQLQLPALANADVEFVGTMELPQLIKDADNRTVAAMNYGRLKLPSEKAFGMATLIVFADREAILVPGSSMSVDTNEKRIQKIGALQEDVRAKWVDLGKHNVLVKYLGLVRIGNKWQELTQFTALYNNPDSRFKRLAGVAYLEGNQAKTTFLNWDQIKSQQVDVGLSASSAVSNELNTADTATIAQLQSQTDLERYLRGLRDFELTHDAAVMLKVPGHEKHVTLAQLMIYRNSPPGTMRSANLVRMIANVITKADLPGEVVTLATVKRLNDDLALLLDAVESDEIAKVIVGSKKAELENTKRSLENIIGGASGELLPSTAEAWFLNAKRLVAILRFEVSMINEIGALTDRVKSGEVAPSVAENKIVEWLRFLPAAAPEGTSRKNISKAMAALSRQAVEKDAAFISNLQNRILVNASGRGAAIKHSKFYLKLMLRLSALRAQSSGPAAASSAVKNVGGINFDPAKMNLRIKRDGQGVPLPLPQQNLEQINIQGFFPVIINIQPVNTQTLPFLLGQGDPQEKLSFLN